MQHQVPQFIKREMKIVGPLTFKQFLFIGIGLLGCGVLYIFLMQKSFFLFVVSSLFIIVGSVCLAFVKIQGRPLTTVIINFFLFSLSKKSYFWQKKTFSPQIIEIKEPEVEKPEEGPALKISEKGKLQNLSTKLETGMRNIE